MQRLTHLLQRGATSSHVKAKPQNTWMTEAYVIQHTQAILQKVLPQGLAPYCHAGKIQQSELALFVTQNAVAAKLKLLMPSLLISLKNQGLELTSIRIKVQVKSSPMPPKKAVRRVSPAAALQLKKLADRITEDAALSDILRKIAAREAL